MDIYSYLNSQNIEAHCRKIRHPFSSIESAFLVWKSDHHLAYYYNRQGAKWPGAEPDNKKSSKSFSRLTAFAGRVGGGWYSVFMTCPVVRQAGT